MSKNGEDIPHVSRRDFLRYSAALAGLAAVGSIPFLPARITTRGGVDGGGGPPTRYPLYIPPVVAPTNLVLNAAPATVDLGGGNSSAAWAYNGSLPGPTINAWRLDTTSIELVNGLAYDTIIHWHGMIVDALNDGHPRHAIQPGSSYNYNFVIDQRACLNWYHPHPDGMTGRQVAMGLAGAFIVRDAEEAALGLPSGTYEVPLIIRDVKLSRTGDIVYTPKHGGFEGNIGLVNGTRNAMLEVDTTLYRFRVLNGANARILRLALDSGAPFILIGNDGGLLEQSVQLTEITAAPAERLDLLIDFSQLQVGDRVMLQDLNSGWGLLEFRVAQQVNLSPSIPTTLSTIPWLAPGDVVTTRTFSFDGMSRINGQVYDMNRVDFQVPLGQTERWIFTTNGNAPHPVHIHAAPFQVQSRTGGRGMVFPWEQGWKDTVLLEDGETVEVLIRFDQYHGLYLMHCHKLEHEDLGMMVNFEIV